MLYHEDEVKCLRYICEHSATKDNKSYDVYIVDTFRGSIVNIGHFSVCPVYLLLLFGEINKNNSSIVSYQEFTALIESYDLCMDMDKYFKMRSTMYIHESNEIIDDNTINLSGNTMILIDKYGDYKYVKREKAKPKYKVIRY